MRKAFIVTLGLGLGMGLTLASPLAAQSSTAATQPAAAAPNSIVGPAYYVSDMKRSLAFYHDALGMTVKMQFGSKDRPEVIVGFGADPRAPSLMLLSQSDGNAPKIDHAHGYDRVALNIGDLRALHARLRAAGYEVDEIKTVHGFVLMAMAKDPDGYRIELVEAKMPAPVAKP